MRAFNVTIADQTVVEGVNAVAAVECVRPAVAVYEIVARPAEDDVVAVPAEDPVITLTRINVDAEPIHERRILVGDIEQALASIPVDRADDVVAAKGQDDDRTHLVGRNTCGTRGGNRRRRTVLAIDGEVVGVGRRIGRNTHYRRICCQVFLDRFAELAFRDLNNVQNDNVASVIAGNEHDASRRIPLNGHARTHVAHGLSMS